MNEMAMDRRSEAKQNPHLNGTGTAIQTRQSSVEEALTDTQREIDHLEKVLAGIRETLAPILVPAREAQDGEVYNVHLEPAKQPRSPLGEQLHMLGNNLRALRRDMSSLERRIDLEGK